VTAPEAFEKTGAQVIVINASPDGCNINHSADSTHLEATAKNRSLRTGGFRIAF
jgi:phosphomannomutase